MKDTLNFLIYMFIIGILLILSSYVHASGSAGLNFETYAAGGASPSIYGRTLLSTGVMSSVNYDWGGGYVLNSGRVDGVIVHVTGYYKVDTTGAYTFGINSDDGTILNINGSTVVNYWGEQGPTLRYGTINLTAGTIVPVEIWYYENGGGAVLQFYWYNNGWYIVPTSNIATDSTYWVPPLGLGASASSFSANSVNTSKINTFVTRTTADSKVSIEQIGNANVTTVQQTGTKNNYVEYYVNGSNNTATFNQSGNASTQANWAGVGVHGSNNTVNLTQTSTGGTKGMFVSVNDNNNNVKLLQKDSGNHYAEIHLAGGNKTVDVTQQGSGNHMASITLTGTATGLNLVQQGSTQQFYSVTHNCATAGGCGTVTVTQGQ